MSIRKTQVLRGKVKAINLDLEDIAMEVAFKSLGPDEIFYRDNVYKRKDRMIGTECRNPLKS